MAPRHITKRTDVKVLAATSGLPQMKTLSDAIEELHARCDDASTDLNTLYGRIGAVEERIKLLEEHMVRTEALLRERPRSG